jgi:hypothetical protein
MRINFVPGQIADSRLYLELNRLVQSEVIAIGVLSWGWPYQLGI